MLRVLHSVFRQNSYFIVTFMLGIGLSIFLTPVIFQKDCRLALKLENGNTRKVLQNKDAFEPKINLAAKPKSAVKAGHGLIRPRFHKAELGIRNKLFVGVLTSSESITSLAVALNKTASKFVDKIMFFIDAPSAQRLNVSSLKLPGIVGFTDTRKALKPFHLIKYVSDNFLDNYDFFFIIKDAGYIQAQKLYEYARRISINHDVHVGNTIEPSGGTMGNICSLDYGILLSNSVVRKMHRSLEWCVKNSASKDDSVNVGQCVIHASAIPCSGSAQGSQFHTYNMDKGKVKTLIPTTDEDVEKFSRSLVIAPLSSAEQYYHIHFYFSMVNAVNKSEMIDELRESVIKASSKASEPKRWPVASQPAATPLTHFDVLRWDHFTPTHKYLNNDFSNIIPLSGPEQEDILTVVNMSISYVENNYGGALKYHNFINGYQKFDASRGMDYIVDLGFRETTSGKTTHKRLEVFKSLGKVELVPVPYVTENVRVHVIIPVESSDSDRILSFLRQYSINAMEKRDLQFLMLVFIYSSNESSKGEEDVFKDVKNKALTLSNKFEKVGNLIKWHSIKLPSNRSALAMLPEPLLDFAVMDTVLRKFPSESLILLGRPNMEVRLDYFNRVRMNTVSGFQVFSPVPFAEYHPDIIYNENRPQPPELDINKNYGHYDSANYRHISFYTADYFKARRKIEDIIPRIKYDKDIWKLIRSTVKQLEDKSYNIYAKSGLYNLFLQNSKCHILRAVEPSLRLRQPLETCVYCRNALEFNDYCTRMQAFNLATRSQLGRLILDYQASIKS